MTNASTNASKTTLTNTSSIIWIAVQAACLLGLAACVVVAPTSEDFDAMRDSSLVHSRIDVPDGCAVGSSGPTLNPGKAIRNARLSAIEALAMGSLEVDVQTISGVSSNGAFEIASQALSGGLRDARILALWAELDRDLDSNAVSNPAFRKSSRWNGHHRRFARIFALACWPDAPTTQLAETPYPEWLAQPPRQDGRICAAGIAGPTRKPANQPVRALADARAALAMALESRIEMRVLDVGHGIAQFAREIDPSPAALRRAEGSGELEESWLDEMGVGPIGLRGVLYGLVCIED